MTTTAGRELTSLTERFGAMLWVRVAIAVAVLLAALLSPASIGVGWASVAPVTAGYVLIAIATELVSRAGRLTAVLAHHAASLVDVAYLAVIVVPTGGSRSQLIFLFYVQLIAVTLLGGHRSGLRIALCDSFVFVTIYAFSADTLINNLVAGREVAQPSTRQVLLCVATFWAVALCTARFSFVNERELRRSKNELRVLADMGAELEQAQAPSDVMDVLLAKVAEAFGFPRGAVLLDGATETMTVTTGGLRARLPAARSKPDAVVMRAWRSKGAILVKQLDPTADPVLAGLLPGARNVVVLPLTADGESLGALAVERGGSGGAKVPITTLAMLGQFAAHAALAARNARLLTEIERMARLDALTGLANRRVFETVLSREVMRAHRTAEELSLIVFDVDHFKAVNDTLGHQAGDEVLRRVATALSGEAREIDLVARYGGEEFAAVLPTCSTTRAIAVGQRMLAAVAADTGIGGVTISAGVATLPADARNGHQLIAAADRALYQAKREGRDRISASSGRLSASSG